MSLRKRTDSFRFALMGLADLWRSQPNARIHVFAAVVVTLAGFFFKISALEWVAVVLCIAVVVAAEAMNTALEYLTDLVSPDFHPLAGKAKDASAAAVLVLAVGAAIVGGLIFFPKIWPYLTQ
ncbi:MAG: diacylglycerol kinase family protein [Saprospiraceae bacterium]|nr:diacylglycerol kinase family protein [Saprospiraceae bacterium]